MNELNVLAAWHPADARVETDQEPAARRRLEAAIAGDRPAVGRRIAGRALIAAAVTTALVAGGVAIGMRTLDERIDDVRRVKVGAGTLDVPEPGAPMNVLVVGSDSRAFVTDQREADAFGTPSLERGQRSDTMALVHVEHDSVTAVWLPRDLLVTDASGNRVQLNSFFNAGPEPLIDAVRELTGATVDHYVQVDFATFIKVVDDLGGVRMFVPAPMRDLYSGLNIAQPGCTTFNGDTALAWSRSRHAEYLRDGAWVDASPAADLDRIARQQALLRAIGTQTRARIGGDVATATEVLDTVVPSLTVDAGMGRDTIRSFIGHLLRPDDLTAVTAPSIPDIEQAGRLELQTRPTGEDFFRWAVRAVAPSPVRADPASGTSAAGTSAVGTSAAGSSC